MRTPPVMGTMREISGVTSSMESTWMSIDVVPMAEASSSASFSGHHAGS